MKRLFSLLLPVSIFILLLLLFVYRNSLTEAASKAIQSQAGREIVSVQSAYVDSAFNYVRNGLNFQITFLEFGATGCSSCRQMEEVMNKVIERVPEKVNVLFINILLPENQELMRYYGVAVIPTQVLLNRKGEEYFRHSGVIAFDELILQFQ